jgi:predicted molibdopterin-dependent oxidoreductase YjgC
MSMRFVEKGSPPENPKISFTLDGAPISALAGDTIASALYAAGIRAWHRSRSGDARGLLCGIGLCFDCLVSVDGGPNQRACQVQAREGMQVQTNLFPGSAP